MFAITDDLYYLLIVTVFQRIKVIVNSIVNNLPKQLGIYTTILLEKKKVDEENA